MEMLHKSTHYCPCGQHIVTVYVDNSGQLVDAIWDEDEKYSRIKREEEIREVLHLSINEQRVRRQMEGDNKERRRKEVRE